MPSHGLFEGHQATILKLDDRYTCFTPDFRMVWKAPSVPRLAQQRMRASPPSAEGAVPAPELTVMVFPERCCFMIGAALQL
jgi:hypothetical protein